MSKYLISMIMLMVLFDTANASVLVLSPNGSTESKPNLALAVPVAVGKTIMVSTPQVIDDISIPTSTKLKVVKGGLIAVNSGKTFSIKGPFEAGPYQVFSGSGKISDLKYVDPIWFEDNQIGNQLAFDAVTANGTVELTTIRNVNSIYVRVPVTIKGSGGLAQKLSAVGNNILVLAADNITVDGITLKGPVTTGNANHSNVAGINCKGRSNITVNNCTIIGKQNGIQNIEDSTAVTNITIQNNKIRYTGYGIVIWPSAHPSPTTIYGSNINILNNDVRLQTGYNLYSENIRGIRISHCDNVSIIGNTSLGAQLSIETWCDGRNRLAKHIEISSNTVDTWLCLNSFDGGILNKNTVDYSLLPTLHAVSRVYGGSSGAVHGIEVVLAKNVTIQGNYVANQPSNGIYTGYAGASSTYPVLSSNLTIDSNTIYKCATVNTTVAGLQLNFISDSIISNNIITDCGTTTYGMAINCGGELGKHFNPVRNLVFSNNILRANYNATYTFRLFAFDNITIDGLVSELNAGTGITIAEAKSINLVIRNSKIINNSMFGIRYNALNIANIVIEDSDLRGNRKGASTSNGISADNILGKHAVLRNNVGL